jgi:hypothetical protein
MRGEKGGTNGNEEEREKREEKGKRRAPKAGCMGPPGG